MDEQFKQHGAFSWCELLTTDVEAAKVFYAKLLVPPTDIPNVGRFCVIQDPQGAVINAITYINMQ